MKTTDLRFPRSSLRRWIREWRFRLQVLRGYFENAGHMAKAARSLGVHRSRIYRHRKECPLFDDTCAYIDAWWKFNNGEDVAWSELWPEQLDDPRVLASGLIGPLVDDLQSAGVLTVSPNGTLVTSPILDTDAPGATRPETA